MRSTSPAQRARAESSDMIVSVTWVRMPERPDRRRQRRVDLVEDEVRRRGRRTAGRRPARDASWPSDASIRSAGPFSALPPMIPLDGDDPRAVHPGVADRGAHPGHCEDRPDRHDGVRRRDDDQLAPTRSPSGPRASRTARSIPREADVADLRRLVAADEVVLEVEPAVVRPDLRPDRLVGHRQDRGRDAERCLERAADVGQPLAARGAARSGRCASRGPGRRAGTTPPRRSARASRRPRTSRPRGPSPAPGSRGRRACT